jgi:hypothetical protein
MTAKCENWVTKEYSPVCPHEADWEIHCIDIKLAWIICDTCLQRDFQRLYGDRHVPLTPIAKLRDLLEL